MNRAAVWSALTFLMACAGSARAASAPYDGRPPISTVVATTTFEKDRRVLQDKLELLRRFLPDNPDAEDAVRKVEALRIESGLRSPEHEYRLRPAVDTASEAYVPVDISGEGSYTQLDSFIDKLYRLPRVIRLETLDVSWVSEGRLRFTGVLRLEFWSTLAAIRREPIGPELEQALADVPADEVEAFRKAVDVYGAKVNRTQALRLSQHRMLRVLAAFDGAPVALSKVSFGEEIEIHGWRALPGPNLRAGLARVGLEVLKLEARPEGACESFEIRGRLEGKPKTDIWTTDRTWMLAPAGHLCEAERAGSSRIPDTTSLRLENGTMFSFELVGSAAGARPDVLLSSATINDAKGLAYRVLADRRHRYFAYGLKAEPIAEGRFRLTIAPVDAEMRERLAKEYGELMREAVAIEYPAPQEVTSGEPLLLDLMINRKTGERLGDVIRVSEPSPLTEPRMSMVNGELRRNGEVLARTGTQKGYRVAFDLQDVGRFIASIEPALEPGKLSDCIPAKLVENPNNAFGGTISFDFQNDHYDWSSRDRILRPGLMRQISMCVDRSVKPKATGLPPIFEGGLHREPDDLAERASRYHSDHGHPARQSESRQARRDAAAARGPFLQRDLSRRSRDQRGSRGDRHDLHRERAAEGAALRAAQRAAVGGRRFGDLRRCVGRCARAVLQPLRRGRGQRRGSQPAAAREARGRAGGEAHGAIHVRGGGRTRG
jgi:hypothetical protein